jgi:hypothetical protein
MVISIASLIIFYCLILLAVLFSNIKAIKIKAWEILVSLVIYLGLLVVFFWLLRQENTIHYSDSGAYWYKTLEIVKQLLYADWQEVLSSVYDSINHTSYNSLLALMIAFPFNLAGGSYVDFEFCVFILFLLPSMFLTSLFFKKIIAIYEYKDISLPVLTLVAGLFPMVIYPALNGMIGSAGLMIVVASFYMIIDRDFSKRDIKQDIVLALLLIYAFLMRRYFSIWVVGFVIFLLIYWLFMNIKDKKAMVNALISYATIGAISLSILLLFFKGLLLRNIGFDYSKGYSVYNSGNLGFKWLTVAYSIGGICLVIMLIGVIMDLIAKRKKPLGVWLLVNIIITGSVIFAIQDMAHHHQYIIAMQVCAMVFIGILHINNMMYKRKILRPMALVLILALLAVNFMQSVSIIAPYRNRLFSNNIYKPEIREDMDSLREIDGYFAQLENQGKQGVYLVGTHTVCEDLLYKLNAPDFSKGYELMYVTQVDASNGFYTSFFDADVIAIEDFAKNEKIEGGSKVITYLKQEFLDSEYRMIADNYDKVKTFAFKDDINVHVFVKQKPFDVADIAYLKGRYERAYPDERELFADRFDAYIQDMGEK